MSARDAENLAWNLLARVREDDPRHEREIAAELVADLDTDALRTLAASTLERAVWRRCRGRQAEIERQAAREAREARQAANEAERQRMLARRRETENEAQESRFARLLDDPGLMYGPRAEDGDDRVALTNRQDRDAFRAWAGDRFADWHVRARAIVDAHPDEEDPETFGEDWHPAGPHAYQRRERARRVAELVDAVAKTTELRLTRELLGSEFALGDGRRTTWGQATVADHEQRAELLMGNATAGVEGAARHLAAVTLLKDHGADALDDIDSPVPDDRAEGAA